MLYKVESIEYKSCCVSKHDYRCAAVEPLSPLPTCPCTKMSTRYSFVYKKICCVSKHDRCCSSATVATCSNFEVEKTGKLCVLHCKIRFRTILPLCTTHGHRAYFPASQLSNLYPSIPTRREHEKHNTDTAIRTAKSGFLRTCVQFGQAADNMQATRRRSCCVLRLYVPIN